MLIIVPPPPKKVYPHSFNICDLSFLLKGGYEREKVSLSQPLSPFAALLVMLLLHFPVAFRNVINISVGVFP